MIILVVTFGSYILQQQHTHHHESKTINRRKTTNQLSDKNNNNAMSSSRPSGAEYQMRIGPLADPNDKQPTSNAWIDPNGSGYYFGDGPFDVPDQNGHHQWIDPEKAGWTKTPDDDINEGYDNAGN